MESIGYEKRDRSLVGTLAGLTYGVLTRGVPARSDRPAPAKPGRSWLDRLDSWFWRQELANREAFLAGSADIVELEQRMRWLEHGRC
jgi:hypothetical protein